jgi:pimeloyl-ACP methyl ester carboxylesterase
MERRIPNSRLVVFEEGSHLHFYEQRADYMATLVTGFQR